MQPETQHTACRPEIGLLVGLGGYLLGFRDRHEWLTGGENGLWPFAGAQSRAHAKIMPSFYDYAETDVDYQVR